MSDSERFDVSYQEVKQGKNSRELPRFLTYLVFQAHSVRIGLQLTICIFLYIVLRISLPWTALGVEPKWHSLSAWFIACGSVAVFDQLILCRSVYTLRKCFRLDIAGLHDRALVLLESIAPDSGRLIPCPKALYHLYRGKFLQHAQQFDIAEAEFTASSAAGLSTELYFISRSELFRQKSMYDLAANELHEAEAILGKTPLIKLEEGFMLYEQQDFQDAKKAFRALREMPSVSHPCGETTGIIAEAYFEACRLRTGEAEEGLEGLSRALQILRSTARYIETLRPLVSALLLERSYYLATHKEPEEALLDLKTARNLSSHAYFGKKAAEIEDELQWRYNISPS